MDLKTCLEITKTKRFEIFIYPKGHVKENRGINEPPIRILTLPRDEHGNLIIGDLDEIKRYMSAEVTELIPCDDRVNVVVEV